VPESLRDRIVLAVRDVGSGKWEADDAGPASPGSIPGALRAAADRLLREALAGSHTRDHAMTLLTADALMTYAMEAEADSPTRDATSR
jgi:hypothetical protein